MDIPMSAPLDRRAAVARLLADRGDTLVVSGLGSPTYDVFAAGDDDANFYLWGAMGGAALVGLGLALAQPSRPVLVITGDGEQLMGLGGLATVAAKRPPNLTIVVIDNGQFGETGSQPSHTGHGVDLAAVAAACGIEDTAVVRTGAELEAAAARVGVVGDGPALVVVKVATAPVERALPIRDGAHLKTRFRARLGLSPS